MGHSYQHLAQMDQILPNYLCYDGNLFEKGEERKAYRNEMQHRMCKIWNDADNKFFLYRTINVSG